MENYQNLIELLKQALLFYGDVNNYNKDLFNTSNIILDNGFQARFALDKIKELESIYKNMESEFNNIHFNNKSDDNYTQQQIDDVFKLFDNLKFDLR